MIPSVLVANVEYQAWLKRKAPAQTPVKSLAVSA